MLATFLVLSILFSALYVSRITSPLYTATSEVMLNSREEQVVDLSGVIGGLSFDSSAVNTELQVLQSRSLLSKVVDKLGLISDPEFNTSLQPPSFISQALNRVRFVIGGPQEDFSDEIKQRTEKEATINKLKSKITVQNVAQSLVFRISVTTEDPAKSAIISDTIADQYILGQIETKFSASERATTWLANRVSELELQLEDDERTVKNFRAQLDLTSEQTLEALERRSALSRNRLNELNIEISEKKALLKKISETQSLEELSSLLGRDKVSSFLGGASDAEYRSNFDTILTNLQESYQAELAQISARRDALADQQPILELELEATGKKIIQLNQLEREAEASRLLYEYF